MRDEKNHCNIQSEDICKRCNSFDNFCKLIEDLLLLYKNNDDEKFIRDFSRILMKNKAKCFVGNELIWKKSKNYENQHALIFSTSVELIEYLKESGFKRSYGIFSCCFFYRDKRSVFKESVNTILNYFANQNDIECAKEIIARQNAIIGDLEEQIEILKKEKIQQAISINGSSNLFLSPSANQYHSLASSAKNNFSSLVATCLNNGRKISQLNSEHAQLSGAALRSTLNDQSLDIRNIHSAPSRLEAVSDSGLLEYN